MAEFYAELLSRISQVLIGGITHLLFQGWTTKYGDRSDQNLFEAQ